MTGPDVLDRAPLFGRPLRLGPALLLESEQISLRHDPSRHAETGDVIDGFRISMSLVDNAMDAPGSQLSPGHISIVDTTSADHIKVPPLVGSTVCRVLSVTVPRTSVAPLLADAHSVQAVVIQSDTPFGRLIQEHLLALRRYGSHLTESESAAVADVTVRLLAGALGYAARTERAGASSTRETLLALIKAHIEQNLAAPTLDVARLCRRFGLSRATLYRLFKPEGGFGRYIVQRRLRRAFEQLESPRHCHWRMIDFALDNRFGNDASFIRAFRRQFGITPGEVHGQANAGRAGGGAAACDRTHGKARMALPG